MCNFQFCYLLKGNVLFNLDRSIFYPDSSDLYKLQYFRYQTELKDAHIVLGFFFSTLISLQIFKGFSGIV